MGIVYPFLFCLQSIKVTGWQFQNVDFKLLYVLSFCMKLMYITPPFCNVEFTGFIFSLLNSNFVFIWKIFLQLVTIPSKYIWQYVVVLFDIFLTPLYDVRVFRGMGVNFFFCHFLTLINEYSNYLKQCILLCRNRATLSVINEIQIY